MKDVKVRCDRCKRVVIGMESDEATCGFYRVDGGYWSQFADDGEKVLCDTCMHKDDRYKEVYRPRYV